MIFFLNHSDLISQVIPTGLVPSSGHWGFGEVLVPVGRVVLNGLGRSRQGPHKWYQILRFLREKRPLGSQADHPRSW